MKKKGLGWIFIAGLIFSSCAIFKKADKCNCPDQAPSKAKKTSRQYK